MTFDLPGDSQDYHLLSAGIQLSCEVEGLSCEIGLRRGGGTKHIIDAIALHCPGRVHIAVDPYGNIEYEHKEKHLVRLDYTNDMLADCMSNVYRYAQSKKVQFMFWQLEDREFFKKFREGVPVYNIHKKIETKYAFVHLDGPHAVDPLLNEIEFFNHRMDKGACMVFDDVTDYYDHDYIERHLFNHGFKLIHKTYHKALYQYAP